MRDQGVRHDLIAAVFALGGEDDLVRLLARVEALGAFLKTEDGANLLTAYRRASNIVRIEEGKDKTRYADAPDPARFREVFTADLPQLESDVYGLSQRPIAASIFGEETGHPAWKDLPSWAAIGTADKAAGADVVRSMAQRAGAKITEIEGSHVIMIFQPDAVTEVILAALKAVS